MGVRRLSWEPEYRKRSRRVRTLPDWAGVKHRDWDSRLERPPKDSGLPLHLRYCLMHSWPIRRWIRALCWQFPFGVRSFEVNQSEWDCVETFSSHSAKEIIVSGRTPSQRTLLATTTRQKLNETYLLTGIFQSFVLELWHCYVRFWRVLVPFGGMNNSLASCKGWRGGRNRFAFLEFNALDALPTIHETPIKPQSPWLILRRYPFWMRPFINLHYVSKRS
jgi:hypothetical protein